MPEPRYIRFVEMEPGAGRVTKRWAVESKSQGGVLGWIHWGMWRRYCFYPAEECLFDATCLRDIAAFLEEQTRAQTTRRPVAEQAALPLR